MASILIVEDVGAVLLSLRIVLEDAGHKVTSARDGAQGLGLCGASSFDLVISDIWMPGVSGAEVIRKGRALSPRTRFLAITGGDPNSREPRDALGGQDFGADETLIKPFEKLDLLNAVARLLDRATA